MRLLATGFAVAATAAALAVAAPTAANAAYFETQIPGTQCTFYTQAGADANPQKYPYVSLDEDTDVGVRNC